MKVVMKKQTFYQDKARRYGETVEVDEQTGERWIEKGIAREGGKKDEKDTKDQNDSQAGTEGNNAAGAFLTGAGAGESGAGDGLDAMKYQDLEGKAKEKGIEVPKKTSRKQLLSLIRTADARRGGEE